ncbi:MAG: helix-hairpin-helix domain-containing protein [Hespellia sp.]|nr:helix-hairpin-helix domain-containing protein [Hespellia sp.]
MRDIRLRGTISVIFMLLLLGCTGCGKQEETGLQEMTIEAEQEKESKKEPETEKLQEHQVWVYVCGAVNQPGVYTFEEGVRVYEVLERAGGLTDAAAGTYLNQAQAVADGEQIYVPTQEEVDTGKAAGPENGNSQQISGAQGNAGSDKININTASREELMTLTGIGEAKAGSIITYREEQGGFQSIEELMQIEGIKEGVFNKIKDDITV